MKPPRRYHLQRRVEALQLRRSRLPIQQLRRMEVRHRRFEKKRLRVTEPVEQGWKIGKPRTLPRHPRIDLKMHGYGFSWQAATKRRFFQPVNMNNLPHHGRQPILDG